MNAITADGENGIFYKLQYSTWQYVSSTEYKEIDLFCFVFCYT